MEFLHFNMALWKALVLSFGTARQKGAISGDRNWARPNLCFPFSKNADANWRNNKEACMSAPC